MPDSNTENATPSPAAARTDRYDPQSIEQKWFDRWAQDSETLTS